MRTAAALSAAVFGIKCQHGAKTKHNLTFPLNVNVSFAVTDESGGEGDHLAACELTGWCPPLTDTSFDLQHAVHFHSNAAFFNSRGALAPQKRSVRLRMNDV